MSVFLRLQVSSVACSPQNSLMLFLRRYSCGSDEDFAPIRLSLENVYVPFDTGLQNGLTCFITFFRISFLCAKCFISVNQHVYCSIF